MLVVEKYTDQFKLISKSFILKVTIYTTMSMADKCINLTTSTANYQNNRTHMNYFDGFFQKNRYNTIYLVCCSTYSPHIEYL